MRKLLRAGSDLQDHVEALAWLDRPRVGELPTQTLQLDEVGIDCGDDLRVHSASRLITRCDHPKRGFPDSPDAVQRPARGAWVRLP